MLLPGALFALFITGFWVYCLVDVVLTPGGEFRRLPKWAWIALVAVTFVIGAVGWLAVRRPAQPTAARRRPGPGGPGRPDRDGGHPGPERPDDDPDFLRSLDRAIRGPDPGDDPAGG